MGKGKRGKVEMKFRIENTSKGTKKTKKIEKISKKSVENIVLKWN